MSMEDGMGDVTIQRATASSDANQRLLQKEYGNKPLYILKVEDPTVEAKFRVFAVLKVIREDAATLDIVGFETSLTNAKKLTTQIAALEQVEKNTKIKIVNIRFPWTKVLELENKSYKAIKRGNK
ncbi:MAG TPA: hypothetical protein VMW91_05685 [Desulfosporosinus sp.]|nr:hypothetical protein [Desulfosporosinus sp.]